MPVEKLPALAVSWTEEDSTSDILSMIVDPFSPAKAGQDPNDAVLLRCGLGFVDQSTDGGATWSSIRPSTDPPNDAGDAVAPTAAGVTYQQIDASYTVMNMFSVLVNWQNASSEWRCWLAETIDDGANWTWVYLGDTGGGGSGVTFQEAIGFYDTGDGPDLPPLGYKTVYSQSRGNCVLSATKAIHLAVQWDNAPTPYPDLVAFIVTMDGSGAVTNVSSPTVILSSTDSSEPARANIVALSATKFVVSWVGWHTSGNYYEPLRAKVCDLTGGGTTISAGSALEIHGPNLNAGSFDAVPLASDEVAYCYDVNGNGGDTSNETGVSVTMLYNISGQSGTIGSKQRLDTGELYDDIRGIAMDSSRFVINMCQVGSSDGHGESVGVRHTGGGSCTFGTPAYFDELLPGEIGSWDIQDVYGIALTSTKFVLAYERDPSAGASVYTKRVGIFTTATLAVSFSGALNVSRRYHSLARIADDEFVVAAEEPVGDEWEVRRYTVSGSTISTNGAWVAYSYPAFTKSMEAWHAPHLNPIPGTSMFLASETVYDWDEDWGAYGVTSSDCFCRAWTFEAPLGVVKNAKGIGMSYGKMPGRFIWITTWDDVNGIDAVVIDSLTLLELARGNLCAATEGELNARTWIAHPYGIFGSDLFCLFYGRMDSPQGLASPEHVIYTLTGGSTFQSAENGFGANYCGSARVHPSGDVYAIKNNGSSSELYSGTLAGLFLRSTLPHASGVEPAGMAVDFYDRSVTIGARVAGVLMISHAMPLYGVWTPLTYNHGNTAGVSSIVIL